MAENGSILKILKDTDDRAQTVEDECVAEMQRAFMRVAYRLVNLEWDVSDGKAMADAEAWVRRTARRARGDPPSQDE